MRIVVRNAAGCLLLLAVAVSGMAQDGIPDRPEDLTFPEFAFEVPDGAEAVHRIPYSGVPGGIPVVVVEDHALPLIRIGVTLRIGGFLDPPDQVGLASLTAGMMRTGGAGARSPDELDERIEFLAASIGVSSSGAESSASLRTITPVFGESLDLFFDVLRSPRFDEARLAVRKGNILEDMKQRNDDGDQLLRREWDMLLYGDGHHQGRKRTAAHLDAIESGDLRAFHRKYWRPEHMVIAVSGDVDTAEILETLGARLAEWPAPPEDAAAVAWPPADAPAQPEPGVYFVEKDIPQGKVRIGHLGPRWTDWETPERAAIQVMDHILGASGFTSRIMQRVRSDEGLAYGAGGRYAINPLGPSGYSIGYQSQSPTVAFAAAICLEEVHRMRDELVSDAELAVAKRALVDSFPRRFESASARSSLFATDLLFERDHAYWVRWREQIEAVTAEHVREAARTFLRPEDMVMLVVGKFDEIAPGDPEGRSRLDALFNGRITRLPARDPLSLEPVGE